MKTTRQMLALAVIGTWLVTPYPGCAQDWTLTSAPLTNWTSLAASADARFLVAAAWGPGNWAFFWPGPIYVSTNAGTSWTMVLPRDGPGGYPEPVISWSSVACSADGKKIFAAGWLPGDIGIHGLPIYMSTNAGLSWTETATDALADAWELVAASADGKNVVACPPVSPVLVSTDSGASWKPASVSRASRGAWSADGTTLVLAGMILAPSTNAAIATSTNLGASWVTVEFTNVSGISVAASADGARLYAAAGPGLIYTSRDAGSTWTPTTAPSNFWSSIASSADGTKLVAAAGLYGANAGMPIYTSADAGVTWTSNKAPDIGWASVAASADGCSLLAAQYGFLPGDLIRPSAIYASQTVPHPVLNIDASGPNLLLSWIVPSTAFVLQRTSSLSQPDWTDVVVEPTLNYARLKYEVRLQPPPGSAFYRLISK